MRLAIDSEAILSVFSGANTALEDVLRPSIIGLTNMIIDDYQNKVLNDGSGLGKDWLGRVFSDSSKHRIITDEDMSYYGLEGGSVLDDSYLGAAYLNGHHLVRGEIVPGFLDKAKRYGIKVSDSSWSVDLESLPGHSLVFSLLMNSSTNYNHSILRPFFSKERRVLIYDRYLKASSLAFFENVLCATNDDVELIVISKFDSCGTSTVSRGDVEMALRRVRPRSKISCYYPDDKALLDRHDRHIHLGSRLQLSFSSGTDCFGFHPQWKNSECEISVHYLTNSSPIRDYVVLDEPGSRRGKIIKVHAKI